MIVPQYWAEGRVRDRIGGKQVTMRRFGWSDTSPEEAQANAEQRARDALARLARGENIERRERKAAYNGAVGVPIREEILGRHEDAVITRNLYGARCLNTPDVLFADIDFEQESPFRLDCAFVIGFLLLGIAAGFWFHSFLLGIVVSAFCVFLGSIASRVAHKIYIRVCGGPEKVARKRLADFLYQNPQWHLRLYRTPAGLRVLVMDRTFSPGSPEVAKFFTALGTDPVYVQMCLNQQCFRARLTPKPWRIGISQHMRPRPGVWPVKPEHLPRRQAWIDDYEAKAEKYAACQFLEKLGGPVIDPKVRVIQRVHDELSRATSGLPLA